LAGIGSDFGLQFIDLHVSKLPVAEIQVMQQAGLSTRPLQPARNGLFIMPQGAGNHGMTDPFGGQVHRQLDPLWVRLQISQRRIPSHAEPVPACLAQQALNIIGGSSNPAPHQGMDAGIPISIVLTLGVVTAIPFLLGLLNSSVPKLRSGWVVLHIRFFERMYYLVRTSFTHRSFRTDESFRPSHAILLLHGSSFH
jgi:hypothetical protein